VAARAAPLKVTIWYPAAGEGGSPLLVGGSRLFRGTTGVQDAPVADGRHPLVLVSHGSGGTFTTLGWIASRLAAAGYIVAGPNHPGTMTADSTPADTVKVWERPADLSAVLSALLRDPVLGEHVDARRIGAMGFSLGGHTVMAIAGARVEREAYARYCDTYPKLPDCVWYARDGVDIRAVDREKFESSMRDPRIVSVVAIDPALAQAYTRDSLEEVAIPVRVVNLERPGSAWWDAVRSDAIVEAIPGATRHIVADAVHLSFLDECQPGAREMLEAEGETDPLCEDGGGRTRADIHAELAERIAAAFEGSW
jgi:predicted dienelactone hydrolase